MMTKVQIRIRKPHNAQVPILKESSRFRVVVCGRRFGKTELAKTALVMRMMRGQLCWYIAPTYQQCHGVFASLVTQLQTLPSVEINKARLRIAFNRGSIEFKSADTPDNLRGSGLDFVVLDECAFMQESVWSQVVQPMLLTTMGHALFISNPNGRNWFYKLHLQSRQDESGVWSNFHHTSYGNPHNAPDELERIKGEIPESVFRQEYLAEFVEGGGAVFRGIDDAVRTPPPREGRVVFGVDWGQVADYTVIVAMDTITKQVIEVDRFREIGWDVQRGRLQAMADRLKPALVLAELNSIGSPNVEALQRTGMRIDGFVMTHASKVQLINSLQLAFEQRTIILPKYPTMLDELQSYTMKRTASGVYQYNAPTGLHDDTVIALALAYEASMKMSARALLW
jgi:hypothetical protein